MDRRKEVAQVELEQDLGPEVFGRVGDRRAAGDEAVGRIVSRHLVQNLVQDLALHPAQLSLGSANLAVAAIALGNSEARVGAVVLGARQQKEAELALRADVEQF